VTRNCRENPHQKAFSRLAAMRRLGAFTLALALGAASAAALVSCGGEDAKLLPGSTAQEITENLDTVKQLAAEGECVGAADAAAEVGTQVESLNGVDPKLTQALQQGVARLDEVVTTCEETTTEAVEPATEATTTERTEPPGQEKKAEKEREKEEKEAEKEEKETEEPPDTPTETTPTEPPPSEDGGTGAPGGVSPGSPVESDDEGDD
jgi:outer membrane biosynthesis protein TonB